MSRIVLTFSLAIAILSLACNNRAGNSNSQVAANSPAASPQSTRQAGTWLNYNNYRYIHVDLNDLVKIDFPQPAEAEVFTLKDGRLSPLSDSKVSNADTIQRLRELVSDSARHWVRIRSGSGTGDAQDSWVNLERVTQADFGEAQDGVVCYLKAGDSGTGQVHIPAELEKTKRYLGIQ